MGEWDLTDELRDWVKPLVEEYIESLKNAETSEDEILKLSHTGINPIQLKQLLEEIGYKEEYPLDAHGWQYDYWWYMVHPKKDDNTKKLCICGCAMCHNINLGCE